MNIYKVSQGVNSGYDTYDSFIVVAKDEETARHTSPNESIVWDNNSWNYLFMSGGSMTTPHNEWCQPKDVLVELIGKADESYTETTIILTSFNAG